MRPENRRLHFVLKTLQIFFYMSFVLLWFKDNFLKFRSVSFPPWIPLAALAVVTFVRFALRPKDRPLRPKFASRRDWVALALILTAVAAVHVPFLLHADGLMDSDEAIPALQGKHIAEGQIPAIYYYGARFQGSLPQQVYALFFRIFGYSIFLVKAIALLVFLAFIAVQYFLVRDALSREAAVLVSAFYVLPFMHLVLTSFDVGSGFPFVLLFGAIIFSLTRRIVEDKGQALAHGLKHERVRRNLIPGQSPGAPAAARFIPALGFVMGLSFWTHQITIIFLLTSSAFLIFHFGLKIKKYAILVLSFLIGMLPVVASELYWNFPLMRMLFGAEKSWEVSGSKTGNFAKLLAEITSGGKRWAIAVAFAALILGLVVLAVKSVKAGKIRFHAVFVVYAAAFTAVYLLSSSSSTPVIRYLYILYMLIPVLWVSALSWLKPAAARVTATAAFLLLFFLAGSGGTAVAYYDSVRSHDADLAAVTSAMEKTGEKYWRGHYWISYVLNSVADERIVVASTTVERYPAYPLIQDTETTGSNYVFLRDTPKQVKSSAEFVNLLKKTGKAFRATEAGPWLLVYGVRGLVFPKNLYFPPDSPIPALVLDGAEPGRRGVVLSFKAEAPLSTGACRLHAEIPGFCDRSVPLPAGERFTIELPYPPERKVSVRYYLDYQGLFLDPTERTAEIDLPARPPSLDPPDLEPLSGFGPTETLTGRNWPSLERTASFRLNRPLAPQERIVLVLYSAFNFDDLFWHGSYEQTMDIDAAGRSLRTETLADGHNTIVIESGALPAGPGPVVIGLKFRYQKVFGTDHWKTAAYLEGMRIDQKR